MVKIHVHFVFDAKHDRKHKARLVASSHLTDILVSSVYLGVVSLCGIRLVLFLAELNNLESQSTNIGNTYLEVQTKEKVCIITGKEFGNLEKHVLLMRKVLCRICSSGLYQHKRLTVCLISMGFFPYKMELDIWMKDCGGHCEYVAVHVDDLLITSKDPRSIVKYSLEDCKFKF